MKKHLYFSILILLTCNLFGIKKDDIKPCRTEASWPVYALNEKAGNGQDNGTLFSEGSLNLAILAKPIGVVILLIFSSVAISIFLVGKLFSKDGRLSGIALNTELKRDDGFVGVDGNTHSLVGFSAIAMTPMRPSGKVEIEGIWYEASVDIGMAEKGDRLIVVRHEVGRLYCEHPRL